MSKKRHGFAKVEYLAIEPEVVALLTAAHTFRSAYEELKAQGKITMSYQHFVYLARNGVKSRLDTVPASRKLPHKPLLQEEMKEEAKQKHIRPEKEMTLGIASNQGFKSLAKEAELDEDDY